MLSAYQRSWSYPRRPGPLNNAETQLCFCIINGPGVILRYRPGPLIRQTHSSWTNAVFLHYQRSWSYPRRAIEQVDKHCVSPLVNGPGLKIRPGPLTMQKHSSFCAYQRSWSYPRIRPGPLTMQKHSSLCTYQRSWSS